MPVAELLRLGIPRAVVRWSESILHTNALPVTDFGPALQELLADMFATNEAAHGAGIAAQQIGVNLAVFVYDCPDEQWNRRTGVVCNPRITLPEVGERRLVSWDEGCLSLPGANIDLARPDTATCSGQDQYGEPIRITAGGVLARCLQHETDHLNGMVFGDRLSMRKRKQLMRAFDQTADRYPEDWPVSPAH